MPSKTLSITVKHKRGGCVSSLLHKWAAASASAASGSPQPEPLHLRLLGIAGNFSIFSQGRPNILVPQAAPNARVLFIAAGSGVTPFLSMLAALGSLPAALRPRIRVLLTTRSRESALAHAVCVNSSVLERVTHFRE